jgi:hypothetical protein
MREKLFNHFVVVRKGHHLITAFHAVLLRFNPFGIVNNHKCRKKPEGL